MGVQDNVAGRIADGRISIGRGIVEEPNYLVVGLLNGSRFLRDNGVEYNKHGGALCSLMELDKCVCCS